MKKATFILFVLFLFSLTSCDEEKINSNYAVYYHCDCSYSPYNQIRSYGAFMTVRRKTANTYTLTDTNGKEQTITLSESEARIGFFYGLGGLIIGTPSLGDGNVWAFDLACPVCDMSKYRLTLTYDGTGRASCEHCGNVYDLNSGGILIQGEGRSLWRYNVNMSGNQLYIQN